MNIFRTILNVFSVTWKFSVNFCDIEKLRFQYPRIYVKTYAHYQDLGSHKLCNVNL